MDSTVATRKRSRPKKIVDSLESSLPADIPRRKKSTGAKKAGTKARTVSESTNAGGMSEASSKVKKGAKSSISAPSAVTSKQSRILQEVASLQKATQAKGAKSSPPGPSTGIRPPVHLETETKLEAVSQPPTLPSSTTTTTRSPPSFIPKFLNATAASTPNASTNILRPAIKTKEGQLPPNYKSVARKVTLIMVALPIAIVTSWMLFERGE